MLWRRKVRPLEDLAPGTTRYVMSESTRMEIEKFVTEMVKRDFSDPAIREQIRRQSLEAYERCQRELFGPNWRSLERW